ncbi:Lnb N-terminal periplasmic domain-containing protein [Zhongshania aquimaris]|uniref:DUF4105 domain-containing protein n=1 Tax=Zhongshania aquimaris TaxID=2857107 RepID=A0ABS6VQY6_9GAMM|nr:DUF4105 domain-containing protein [Zhongshania aquimaris]MBW2940463.1 DUF4105 domain-containing protein [Zhongshania aquimaris]
MPLFRITVQTLLLSLSLPAFSQYADASELPLAESPSWRALLHFPRQTPLFKEVTKSYIDDRRFFLAEDGDQNRKAEFDASLAAFAAKPTETACRFPARYLWLYSQHLVPAGLLSDCGEYNEWRDKIDIERVVLVLAASYLNSPSSMYGHTFLRLDPAGERSESAFLSYALNFAASIPPDENGMLYAYRGILGGYPGLFSMQPYYEKIQEYSRLENRDIWEYPLSLSAAQIDLLLAHTWELRNINFDYYFFDENCSFRLLELLEVALPGLDLTSQFAYAAMPVDTVRAVVESGLTEAPNYRPSKRRELEAVLAGLDGEQRKLVLQLAANEQVLEQPAFLNFSVAVRQQLVVAAYRYLRYSSNREQRTPEQARRSLKLLSQIQSYGVQSAPQPSTPRRPDLGHSTSMFGVAGGTRKHQQYADMEWRISYHDALDVVSGYPPGATLMMGQLKVRWQEDTLRLQRFDPVAIRSLAPRNEFFAPLSWQVAAGLERLDGSPEQSLVARVSGGAGVSRQFLSGIAYVIPGARLEHNDDAETRLRIAPKVSAGLLWQGDRWASELSVQYLDFGGGRDVGKGVRQSMSLSTNLALSTNQAIRASVDYRKEFAGESAALELSWRRYF